MRCLVLCVGAGLLSILAGILGDIVVLFVGGLLSWSVGVCVIGGRVLFGLVFVHLF